MSIRMLSSLPYPALQDDATSSEKPGYRDELVSRQSEEDAGGLSLIVGERYMYKIHVQDTCNVHVNIIE